MNKLLVLALVGLLAVSIVAANETADVVGEGPQAKEEQQPQQNQQEDQQDANQQQEIIADNDEDRVAIMEEWEKHMQDFVPDEMLTFEVNSKSEELFMEDITVPTQIRGAFFVSYFSEEKIDFAIRDPTKKRIFHKIDKREGIFSLNVTDVGQYEFLFSNIKGKDKKSVTFALDIHNTTDTHLSHHDLDPVEKKLEHVSTGIKDYLSEQRFASKRQISQLESIQSAHKRLLIFSVFEIIIVVVATAWQIYYIKKILDNKRIV